MRRMSPSNPPARFTPMHFADFRQAIASPALRAITDQKLTSVETVGKAINAGTNCGSCRPAIARLIEETGEDAVAA